MQISEAFLEMKDDPCGGNSDGSVVEGFGDELVPAGIFFAGFHGVQQQTGHIRCHAQPHNILPQRQARIGKLCGNKSAEIATGGSAVHEFTLVKEVHDSVDTGARLEGISRGSAQHTVPGGAPADHSAMVTIWVKSQHGAGIARVHGTGREFISR